MDVQKAYDFVLNLFKKQDSSQLFYHTYGHTVDVVRRIEELAKVSGIEGEELEIVVVAGWFHDVGYLFGYDNHEDRGIEIVRPFLKDLGWAAPKIAAVAGCIEATKMSVEPRNLLEEIIVDADISYGVTENFFETGKLLQLEWEHNLDKIYLPHEWEQLQHDFLLTVKFYTPHAQLHFRPIVTQNFIQQKDLLRKALKKGAKQQAALEQLELEATKRKNFNDLEATAPIRGIQTFFRTSYRNHISLSAIADNKANMMISINSIVITLIFAVFSLGIGTFESLQDSKFLPAIIFFIITSLGSLVLAVLSVMPKVTNLNKKPSSDEALQRAKRNIVFFGNFVDLKVEDYEFLMEEVFNSSDLLYGNMVRDTYFLGKVLNKKYRLLSISYATFLIGFVISVIAFLATTLF